MNQPRDNDAVLGGKNPPPTSGVILGGIEGVKRRLTSATVEQRIAAVTEALKYGNVGLELVMQALQDESERVRRSAYLHLWDKTDPQIRKMLENYMPTDMVAWWRLDEAEGNTVTDSAGTNHGTLIGPTPITIAPGRMPGLGGSLALNDFNLESCHFVEFVLPKGLGSALYFDGDDYVKVPNDPILNFGTGDLSICAGIKAHPQGIDVILDKRVETSGPIQGYSFSLYHGELLLQLADGIGAGWTNYLSGFRIAKNQWHYLTVTVDRDLPDGGRWYVDGIEVGQRFNPTGRQGSLNNLKPLIMGRRSDHPTWPGFFKGSMSDIRLFNRVLEAPEIQAIYKMVGVPVQGLMGNR
ncbi:MAG TPA: hypothetical protein DC064_31470 [Cyanobacteria bacterium UBA9273]|nr:hypothetical protein [Cyanobacteria bacterium UBA9273]